MIFNLLLNLFNKNNFQDDIFNPRQIKKRKKYLNKILEFANFKQQFTSVDIQKKIGLSEKIANNYLEYLTNLNKLSRINERGREVVYRKNNFTDK